jgi:putative tryptophan/tyrosine transport system substrate-binding protein
MKRRDFIALTGGAVAANIVLPHSVAAQQRGERIPHVGIIDDAPIWDVFRKALRDFGRIEGQNIIFDYRVAEGDPARLAAAAAELVHLPVDVLATFGTPASRAAKAATTTIPVVALSVGDPVRAGLVASLAHPGGNVTGNTILGPDLGPKRLQLIKEVVPSVSRVAFLWNPDNASNVVLLEELRAAAPALGLELIAVEARTPVDFERAFAAIVDRRAEAVLTTNDPLHQRNIATILEFMNRNRLPGVFQTRENVVAGGFMSYGASFSELFRQGATYVDKILRGTRPEDLPVQQPERFELVVNVRTAKVLGINLPESFLLRADEVIE